MNLSPCTQFSYILVSSSNIGPEVTKKLAQVPFLSDPISSDLPSIWAGTVVSAARAVFLSSPYSNAFFSISINFEGDFKPCVVSEKVSPASCIFAGLVGA